MHFTVDDNCKEEDVWNLIMEKLSPDVAALVSPASSSFYRTEDGIECSIRKANGDLIANGYSESDRMERRRWTFDLVENR